MTLVLDIGYITKIGYCFQDADNFSDFQMERLRKRKKFQDSMDDVEAEITKRVRFYFQ